MADDITSHLPLDIIEIILLRLPVKPLHRFRSVSKSWNTIISDPVFVKNHIRRRSKYSNSQNLFLRPMASTSSILFSVVKIENKKLQTLPEVIEAPFGCWWRVCRCDGILLLTNGTYRRFVLWNPSTRTAQKLWHRSEVRYASFGLCHDPNTDDFKVVIVAWEYYSVYSCKNKSWIMLKKEYEPEYTKHGVMERNGACVDGASYWVAKFGDVIQIMYFDPRDDKFKMLQKPENLKGSGVIYLVNLKLVNLKGCLCLYCNLYDTGKTMFRIWTKENGIDNSSWKELAMYRSSWSLTMHPLCFVENKIVFRINDDRLVLYSPSDKRFEEFEEDTQHFCVGRVPVPYMESLYFPIEKPRPKSNKRKRKCLQE